METITFRCTTCQSVLKVGADKAGRNAKCTKCGTALTIPAAESAPPPPPAKKLTAEQEDAAAGYQLKDIPSAEEEERRRQEAGKTAVIKKPGRREAKKLAKITNPAEWRRVGLGMRVIAGGLGVWLAAFLLFRVPVVIGMAVGPEYAVAANDRLVSPNSDPTHPEFNLCAYGVALIAGNDGSDTLIWVLRFALVLTLLQGAPLVAGYFICLAAPDRYGIRLQLMVLFALAFFDFLFLVVFKLLPICGAYRYITLPIALPEVAMVEMNADRIESIFTFWLSYPVLEAIAGVLVMVTNYLGPAVIATLVHSVAMSIKSEKLEAEALITMKLGYSQLFIQLAWYMMAMCGGSLVLLWLLRITYAIGAAFFVYQLILTITALIRVAPVVEEQLGDEAATAGLEQEEEDDEDDEDEDE
ncbi:MAG TPA: hypothetical protein VE988_15550 [Gemmataceae bacterium]|nr:hypothetical protein [Gemmataceae bacterium]